MEAFRGYKTRFPEPFEEGRRRGRIWSRRGTVKKPDHRNPRLQGERRRWPHCSAEQGCELAPVQGERTKLLTAVWLICDSLLINPRRRARGRPPRVAGSSAR